MSHEPYLYEAHPCILVVEDEFLIRLMLSESLREAGYHVIEACNADEALVVIDLTLPDLIISDVRMPGSLDGMELLALVKRSHPKLPIIITSGHLREANALEAGADYFIPKPYAFEPILKAVHDELIKPR